MAPVVAAAVVSGAASVVGGIINWLSGKSQANAQKAYINMVAQLHNQWLATRDTKVKEILDQLQAKGQDVFGPQVTTTQGTTTQNINESETPFITPEYAQLAGLQKDLIAKRLQSPTGLPPGYEETGISAINQASQGSLNDLSNLARQRGISEDVLKIGSPAERSRRQQIASFRAETPLKARELQNQDLGLAQNVLAAFGRATNRTGHNVTSQYGTTTSPADLSALAALLLPPGPQAATMA